MSKRNKNTKKELEDFLRYSQDQMSDEERNAFERSMQQDPFDAEALEGLSSITPEEARSDMAGLQSRLHRQLHRRTSRSTRTMWYRIAASVAVLVVVTSVLFTLFNGRMGQLDRKVADAPEPEMEESTTGTLETDAKSETSGEILPMQTIEKDEEPAKIAPVQARKSDQDAIEIMAMEAEVEADITVERISEELAETDELADIRTEEIADVNAAEMEIETEILPDEVAAPAPAMAVESRAVAKSRKREATEQLQMAGVEVSSQHTLSGVVISGEDNQPLPGVIIAVKGSNTGTVTDLEGKFQISIEDDSDNTLIAQFIGMEQKEIPLQDQKDLVITLEPDAQTFEEIVIIGTGARQIEKPVGYTVTVTDLNEPQGGSDFRGATPAIGKKEYNEYIKSQLRFPEEEDLTRAVVVLNFVVGHDGKPGQINVLKSPGKAFSDEAIRLLIVGPDWEPAEKDGQYYDQHNRIRIVFKKERP